MVNRRFLEAKHAQLKCAYRLHVLGPLRDIAGFFIILPNPGKHVHVARVGESSPRFGQLNLLLAGENGQQSLWCAVADNVVAFEHDEALLDHVLVGLGQHADPGHARDRVKAKHEDIVAEGFLGQRVPFVAHVQRGLVGYARMDIRVNAAVFGAAVHLEKIGYQWEVVHDRKYAVAFVHCKVVVAAVKRYVGAYYGAMHFYCRFRYLYCAVDHV